MKIASKYILIIVTICGASFSSAFAQSKSPLVPEDFKVPDELLTESFRLRPLTPDDVILDYEAVMTSIDHLHASKHMNDGHGWPSPQLTFATDLRHLKGHHQEHLERKAFTYTVMNLDESVCFGCVYISPTEKPGYDATIRMWVRTSAFYQGLDPILFEAVKEWIVDDWPFENPAFPGREINWKEWSALPGRR